MKELYTLVTILRKIGRSGHHVDNGVVFFLVQPTRCDVIQYSLLSSMLYMFRAISLAETSTALTIIKNIV